MNISFIKLSKKINNLKTLNAIYVYTLLRRYKDNKTKTSFISERRISELSGITEREVRKIISSFKEINNNDLFTSIDTIRRGKKTNNQYHFDDSFSNFMHIDCEFIDKPLKGVEESLQAKCKAFLLALKTICVNNTNTIKFNKVRIAEELGIDRKTLNKYLNLLVSANYIIARTNEIILNTALIIMDYLDSTEETKKFLAMHKHCVNYNVKPAERKSLAFLYILIDEANRLLNTTLKQDISASFAKKLATGKPLNYKRKIELPKFIME